MRSTLPHCLMHPPVSNLTCTFLMRFYELLFIYFLNRRGFWQSEVYASLSANLDYSKTIKHTIIRVDEYSLKYRRIFFLELRRGY